MLQKSRKKDLFTVVTSIVRSKEFEKFPSTYRDIFLNVVQEISATHQDFDDHGIIIKIQPGQCCISRRRILSFCSKDVKRCTIDKALKKFVELGYLSQEVVHKKTVITILHSELYEAITHKNSQYNSQCVAKNIAKPKMDISTHKTLNYDPILDKPQPRTQPKSRYNSNYTKSIDRVVIYSKRESSIQAPSEACASSLPLSQEQIQSIQKQHTHLDVPFIYQKMVCHYEAHGKKIPNEYAMLKKWCLGEKSDKKNSQPTKIPEVVSQDEIEDNIKFFNSWYENASVEKRYGVKLIDSAVMHANGFVYLSDKNFKNYFME